jgi:1-aminocyclopropane-1-carboxylate deaminase/D-cysteine desulfhydrase-like pyridoxal-dependent ACC family enzyme
MLALARISNKKEARFVYFVRNNIPPFLRKSPNGNYKAALDLNMEVVEVDSDLYRNIEAGKLSSGTVDVASLVQLDLNDRNTMWVPQGGAMMEAEGGIRDLCSDLLEFTKGRKGPWKVVFCSGTGG